MRPFIFAAAASVLAPVALGDVGLEVVQVRDTRLASASSDPLWSVRGGGKLEVFLRASGPELAFGQAVRVEFKSAKDDTGAELPKAPDYGRGSWRSFQGWRSIVPERARAPVVPPPPGNEPPLDVPVGESTVELDFGNPPRAAKVIKKLVVSVEVCIPKLDPDSIITVKVAASDGEPIEHEMLQAADVKCMLLKPGASFPRPSGSGFNASSEEKIGENQLGYNLSDPNHKIAGVEFFDAEGKKLKTGGSRSSEGGNHRYIVYTLKEPLPADATATIYLATEKSILKFPIELENIPLP